MRRSAVIALALALASVHAGCGDEEVTTVTETVSAAEESTATTTAEDGAPPPADTTVRKLTGFTSPTGNIGCQIDRRSVRCDIARRDWQPSKAPKGCDLDYGQGIELRAGAAPQFVCAGDTTLGAGGPLAYGQSISAGLLRCESLESGMTCTDAESGRGFTISKQSYKFR